MPSNCNVTLNPIIQPPMRPVVAIQKGNPTAVTCGTVNGVGVVTTIPHYYVNGTIVRFDVPAVDGMPEINGMTGEVTVIDAVSFEVNIDSTKFTAFNIPLDANPITRIYQHAL